MRPRLWHSTRISGNTRLMGSSRSRCISRNVEGTNKRTSVTPIRGMRTNCDFYSVKALRFHGYRVLLPNENSVYFPPRMRDLQVLS